MDDNKILFSGIIPVLNGEIYLRETIESIRNQTIGSDKIQLILVDDGSTDTTLEIMNDYKDAFGLVDVIVNESNVGVGASLNKGIEKIQGKYSFFFGGDDLLDTNTLEEVNKFFVSNDVEMLTLFVQKFGESKKAFPNDVRFNLGNRVINTEMEYQYPQILNGGCFFKSETLKDRRYNEKLNHFADGDFMLKFVEDYKRYGVLKSAKMYYRIKKQEESLSRKMREDKYIYSVVIKESLIKLIEYSKLRNNGVVSKYMQRAFINRLGIYLRRTKILETLTKDEVEDWLSDVRTLLLEVEEDIILENDILDYSEKNLMINIKRNISLSNNGFHYKDGSIYYENKLIAKDLKETFKIDRTEKNNRIIFRIVSNFFDCKDITLKIDRRIPFLKRDISNPKIMNREYFFGENNTIELSGCVISFSRRKILSKKNIYIYIGEDEFVFPVRSIQ